MEEGRSSSSRRPHSVPVPQLYKEASKILQRLERREGSLKSLVYSSKYKNYKKIYALLSKAWDHRSEIKNALTESRIFQEQPNFNPHLAHILTTELIGKGFLSGNCKPVQVIQEYEEKLKSLIDHRITKEDKQLKSKNPRYVRVNTLRWSVEEVETQLAEEGWFPTHYDKKYTTYDHFLQLVKDLENYQQRFMYDYHIPELLVFPPNTPFWDSALYQENAIILQDKASCLPVFISSVCPGASVIDACAAPGNKTSQIAASIKNKGRIVASEKDFNRFKTLTKLVEERGATCVSPMHQDFTKLSKSLTDGAEHIFLDPTCSSSGTDVHQDKIAQERLQNLATFQAFLLQHALSIPTVREVVYSTCSVNAEENEEVIQTALNNHLDFELEDLRSKLNGWKHFGNDNYEFGSYCLRTVPELDRCNGFFVAKFVRKGTYDTNVGKKKKKSKYSRGSESFSLMDETTVSEEYSSGKRKRKSVEL